MDQSLNDSLRNAAFAAACNADPAHDFGHVMRVVHSAVAIARTEGADLDVVYCAALLHELVNLPKSHPQSARSGDLCAVAAEQLLRGEGADEGLINQVTEAIRVHAFSAGIFPRSLEAKVLQDADRLDAIGAIGIARCFATCASMGRPLYSTNDPFCERRVADDKSWGLDHFFRKLLRITDSLHTDAARGMACERSRFMDDFLRQLRCEIVDESIASLITGRSMLESRGTSEMRDAEGSGLSVDACSHDVEPHW
ncbi:MAG TPA: HD domain-containing protein [Polyangiaceae bacterium]|nr:HD domain-containing protein [Polyangiaceae bacterium]